MSQQKLYWRFFFGFLFESIKQKWLQSMNLLKWRLKTICELKSVTEWQTRTMNRREGKKMSKTNIPCSTIVLQETVKCSVRNGDFIWFGSFAKNNHMACALLLLSSSLLPSRSHKRSGSRIPSSRIHYSPTWAAIPNNTTPPDCDEYC